MISSSHHHMCGGDCRHIKVGDCTHIKSWGKTHFMSCREQQHSPANVVVNYDSELQCFHAIFIVENTCTCIYMYMYVYMYIYIYLLHFCRVTYPRRDLCGSH